MVENINQLPIINSEIVMAVSLMIFFVTFRFPEGYVRLILAHVSFCTPYVILSIMPKLAQMDTNIYEAALDLGATPFQALVKVLFPIIMPGIISGFAMSFTISLDDFIITQINKGTGTGIETLSTYIYSDARIKGLEPFWFAVFSIIFVVVLAILLIINMRRIKMEQPIRPKERRHFYEKDLANHSNRWRRLLLSLCFSLAACNKAKADKFVIYNWEEYISEEVRTALRLIIKRKRRRI